MKKNVKKILAALLCACVLLGGAVTAFASEYEEPVQSYSVSNVPELHPGEQFQMVVNVYPENAPCTIRYEIEDESIATIDENGLITAHHEGYTGMWVYIEYSNGRYGSGNSITVTPVEESTSEVTPDTTDEPHDSQTESSDDSEVFRCDRCDWYDEHKNHPVAIVRCIFWMIHTITHMVQQINHLT